MRMQRAGSLGLWSSRPPRNTVMAAVPQLAAASGWCQVAVQAAWAGARCLSLQLLMWAAKSGSEALWSAGDCSALVDQARDGAGERHE